MFCCALALLCIGCATTPRERVVLVENEPYIAKTSTSRTSQEINQLKRNARAGKGEAAYLLSRYYANEGRNAKLAEQYEELALALDYPVALFRAAIREWASAPKPDLDRIEARARKAKELGAIELGVTQVQELLDEVILSRETGRIPSITKLRLVLEH